MPARPAVKPPHDEPSQIDRALIELRRLIPSRGMSNVIRHKETFGSLPANPAPIRLLDQAGDALPSPNRTAFRRASGVPIAPAGTRSTGSCTTATQIAGIAE